jgi:hypothetical protein
MTWLAWRQFRAQTWIAMAALIGLGAILVVSGHAIAQMYHDAGVPGCTTSCTEALGNFLRQLRRGPGWTVYNLAAVLMYVVPGLVGIFWGAPMVARELESGTHRLAWHQSITRTRWLATKLAVVGGVAAASVGLLSWAVTAWASDIDRAAGNRFDSLQFGARGVVPVGYALFAFTVGVTLGMLLRRTVPAMAATLAVYIGAVVAMPLWVRAHLLPTSHGNTPLNITTIDGIGVEDGSRIQVYAENTVPGSWLLSDQVVTPAGQPFIGPADGHCGPDAGPRACEQWLDTLGLRHDFVYQPANHFWPLQYVETGIFVATSVLLAAFCLRWLRRRVS